jgi:hypothetical protein
MNLTPFSKNKNCLLWNDWCLHGHLRVSSQDLLMGQQVTLPSLTPPQRHGTESRGNDWSSEGVEYPSGLEEIKYLHLKAEYMTESHFRIKKTLANFSRSIHDARGVRACAR